MVQYDEVMKANTKGVEWMKTIKRRLKYETVFLNSPLHLHLSEADLSQIEHDIKNNDLFMTSGFLQPGLQTILILDTELNSSGRLQLVIYCKQYLIEHMQSKLQKPLGPDL